MMGHKKHFLKSLIQYTSFLLVLLLLIVGCSRKKNSFVSRNLHAVGTEYNVLYNGNLALQAGLDELEASYQDNYWDILPVERMQVKEDVALPGQKPANPNFERAEEKAVKAVQKHSMLINETEYNPQIDEAYLLLGKARYYDQRFVPALEAFNYILQFMPDADRIVQAKVWRERTHMRLDYNEIAIRNLNKLLKEEQGNIEQEDLVNVNATLSQAYLNMEMSDSALVFIKKAANLTENREFEARYKFITAQIHAKKSECDSAFAYYNEIIDLHRKIPRRYYINAFVEKIKLFNPETDSKVELLETIEKLEENRENRPWLDMIYSRKAIYFENEDSLDLAVENYNKSLRAKSGADKYLRGNTYAALGKISFDQSRYEDAGKYYDSAMTNYVERTPEYRLVKKKRNNLEDVILYEARRRSADSIFNVLAMSHEEKEAYYAVYIEELKAKEKRLEEQTALEAAKTAQEQNAFQQIQNSKDIRSRANRASFGSLIQPKPQVGVVSFYFYNQQTVARGKRDFRSKWGKRKLEDNWRRKNKINSVGDDIQIEEEVIEEEKISPEFTTTYYIEQLPSGMSVLDSIADSRDFAYYQLGVTYKEKFKRDDLAEDRFTSLIGFDPEEKLLLPGLYNLYLVYINMNAFAKAESIKNRILNEFPDTRYAQNLRNPDAQIQDDSSPAFVYKRLYKEYEKEHYDLVIKDVERYVTLFNGDPIVPKLELLKAFSAGRLYGFEEYKRGIDYVALNFPNSEVGKAAKQLATEAEKIKAPEKFVPEEKLKDFKLVYRFENKDTTAIDLLKSKIEEVIEKKNYSFTISIDVYSPQQDLLVVHGLSSKVGAKGLGEFMEDNTNGYDVRKEFISIATENYKMIQIYKNLDDYEKEML